MKEAVGDRSPRSHVGQGWLCGAHSLRSISSKRGTRRGEGVLGVRSPGNSISSTWDDDCKVRAHPPLQQSLEGEEDGGWG